MRQVDAVDQAPAVAHALDAADDVLRLLPELGRPALDLQPVELGHDGGDQVDLVRLRPECRTVGGDVGRQDERVGVRQGDDDGVRRGLHRQEFERAGGSLAQPRLASGIELGTLWSPPGRRIQSSRIVVPDEMRSRTS